MNSFCASVIANNATFVCDIMVNNLKYNIKVRSIHIPSIGTLEYIKMQVCKRGKTFHVPIVFLSQRNAKHTPKPLNV